MPEVSELVRVVVVDDDRTVADTLAEVVQMRGFGVLVCYEAATAITAGQVFDPHVLICEVAMPGMNGIELARHYARHHPACRVLLISGHASARRLMHEDGGDDLPVLFDKPVPPARILDFIENGMRVA